MSKLRSPNSIKHCIKGKIVATVTILICLSSTLDNTQDWINNTQDQKTPIEELCKCPYKIKWILPIPDTLGF